MRFGIAGLPKSLDVQVGMGFGSISSATPFGVFLSQIFMIVGCYWYDGISFSFVFGFLFYSYSRSHSHWNMFDVLKLGIYRVEVSDGNRENVFFTSILFLDIRWFSRKDFHCWREYSQTTDVGTCSYNDDYP